MKNYDVNETVNVTAIGFRKGLVAYPKRMEYKGQTYNFIDAGLRCLIKQGNIIAQIVTLSDGISNYKLKSDGLGSNWTLLSISR